MCVPPNIAVNTSHRQPRPARRPAHRPPAPAPGVRATCPAAPHPSLVVQADSLMSRRDSRGPRAACECGLAPFVGVSRSAKNPGRVYASCPSFPASGHCRYFAWMDGWRPGAAPAASPSQTPAGGPDTPGRGAAEPRPATSPTRAPTAVWPKGRGDMGAHCPPPAETLSIERFAALLVVVCDGHAPLLQGMLGQPQERVRLVLLPASAHPPDYCTRHLAVQAAEGRLPRAPASLRSLQPPYVTLRHCPAARGIAAAVGWTSSHGPALVLDSETTGLSGECSKLNQCSLLAPARTHTRSLFAVPFLRVKPTPRAHSRLCACPPAGRDYIHQLAVLNLSSCQLLTALLRTCPRTTGPAAAKASPAGAGSVCGCLM